MNGDRSGQDTKPAKRQHRNVLPGVQYLRGWAALFVVIAHMNGMMLKERYFGVSPMEVEAIGAFGVAVFFCISGFIIALVSLDRDLKPKISIANYTRRRIERIIPFLWVCVLGYAVLHSMFGEFELAPMLRALFIWPVGEMRPNVVWSLRHEFLFYVLFAATMLGKRRRIWPLVVWCLVPLIASPFYHGVADALGGPQSTLSQLYFVVLCGSNSGANVQFGAGLLIAIAYLKGGRFMNLSLRHGPLLCLLAFILGGAFIQWTNLEPVTWRPFLWTPVAACILLIGVLIAPPTGPLHRLGLILGNASFAIYLVHNPVLLAILEGTRFVPSLPPFPALVGAVIVTAAAGVAAHKLVEVPLLNLFHPKRTPVAAMSSSDKD